MSNAKKAKKRLRFTGVQKRSTYSEMKESEDKTKTFVVMLKNNPKILDYFTEKNALTRTPELAKIIVWTEQYARKEHMRSPLYSIVEKYKDDKKFKHASAQKEIKKLIQNSISYIKNTNSDEYQAVLKVLENVNKKELDTDKVFRNKEWYRPLVRTLGAMGLGAYLAASAFWAVPETKPEPVVEEIQIEDDSCEKSLDLCLGALNGLNETPKIVTRKVPVPKMPNKNEYCSEYLDEIEDMKGMFKDGERDLLAKIGALNKDLKKERSKTLCSDELKQFLLKKLDIKFSTLNDEEYKEIYLPTYRKKWENRINKCEKAGIFTLIELGDPLLVTRMEKDKILEAIGHGNYFSNGKFADFRKGYDRNQVLYFGGNAFINKNEGSVNAAKTYIENIYNTKKSKYGTSILK